MTNQSKFESLFRPVSIGKMSLRNRIVMPAMGTNLGSDDGSVTQRLIDYHEARTRGGVGLNILEVTCIDYPMGKAVHSELSIDDDKYLPALKELTRVIHREGGKAAVQLHHAGRETSRSLIGGQPVAPSAIAPSWRETPRDLAVEEVRTLVEKFARGAERAKRAGFDGVEIHGAHGYLVAQFLSAWSNKRRDDYGGDLSGRARFLLEIIKAVKALVGADFPVWCRLNGMEYGIEDGVTIEDTSQVARWAQDAGADAIHVSAYGVGPNARIVTPELVGEFAHLAEAVKKSVTIPVIAVGRIDADFGERMIREGKADLVSMGRGLLADPGLPQKLASGRLADITLCINCLECLDRIAFKAEEIACSVNPALGREKEYELKSAARRKKVLIAGGGPAGMEAACVARLRGHEVTLFEKEGALGGQLVLAAIPPHKSEIGDLNRYLSRQVSQAGVKVELGKEATPKVIRQMKPDAVVVATGMLPLVPEIPGVNAANVVGAELVLRGKVKIGEKVVVIGGGLVGCETAAFLAESGKTVTIVEMMKRMLPDTGAIIRRQLLNRLADKGVVSLTGVTCHEVTAKGLALTTSAGQKKTIAADNIVLACGAKANTTLYDALKGKVPEIYQAGDCGKPGKIIGAIADGARIGREL